MKMRASILLMAATPVILAGCMPDIPEDPVPTRRVSAVFDSDTSTIPLPNTAALEGDGTLPRLDGAGDGTANGDFLEWLDKLEGWSESTPITIPFTGMLDEATVTPQSVRMFRFDSASVTEVEIASVAVVENDAEGTVCNPTVCGAVIVATPAAVPEPGVSYAVVATKDIKGADGQEVGESSALFFAASLSPLVDEYGTVTVGVLEDDPATANTLEALRLSLAPIFEVAKVAEIPRDRIASMQGWTVAKNPFSVLDPATSTIPIPNSLGIEADGTFPAAALDFCGGPGVDSAEIDTSCGAEPPAWAVCETSDECAGLRVSSDPPAHCIGGRCVFTRCAQGEFDTYLDGLHGWPTTTPITLPVTSEIDESTLNDQTVQLWAMTDGGPVKVEGTSVGMTACGDEIVINLPPGSSMNYNTRYVAFATTGVQGVTGSNLLPPGSLLLAIMPNAPGEFVGDCSAEDVGAACDGGGVCGEIPAEGFKCVASLVPNASDSDAASVMAIRPLMQPLVEAVTAATGLQWRDLAAVWGWSTWTDTFLVFDPLSGAIPFPHTLLTAGCEGDQEICNLPDGEGATAPIINELRRREGFSTTAPHWIGTIGPPLDPASVTHTPQESAGVLFAEVGDDIPPPAFPADEMSVAYEFDNILVNFARPLAPDTLVAGLTTTNLIGGNGFPAQPMPSFVFLRSEFSLVDADGNKTIKEIPDDATAAVLEESRGEFSDLFLVAALFGYDRTEVNNAWAFTTGETYEPLQILRAVTASEMAAGAPTATGGDNVQVTGDTITNPDGSADVDTSNIDTIYWNLEFESYRWLSAENTLMDAPMRESIGVTIYTPAAQAGCQAPYNVAIAQHGLGNYRNRFSLAVANRLAAECIATVAMDLPLHGGRMLGPVDLHPTTYPEGSGDGFVSEDFVGTVNLFKQSVVDQTVLVQMIKQGGFNNALGATFTDATTQIGYIGNSLGAFVGTLLTTIDPNIGPTVLNVVGGNYGIILKDSESFNPILVDAGIPADTFDEIQALHLLQWLGEHADPYAFAPYPVLNPLTELVDDAGSITNGDVLPVKDVMIQMVVGDTTIPNSSTTPVAQVMGVEITDTTFPEGVEHGFLSDVEGNPPAKACALTQAAEWMSSSFAGAATLTTSVSDCGL